uniref:dATP/dGTP diphosphohydrolase N-terminal domain-containing protein n=2 Tax=viral metagenome TaxID=1070528 RepID=A0A6M3JQF8_9ZZZZ
MSFMIKDSGARETFASGMVRDTTEGKINYLLTRDGPMYERWARHLTKGAGKYDKRNWMKASGPEELERACESATRHFEQWLRGETDEDHAAAVIFNINEVEYIKSQTGG